MSYKTVELPADMSQRLTEALNLAKPPATLGDLFEQAAVFAWSQAALVSPTATRHVVVSGDGHKYTHCALDALALPSVTGQPVVLRSACPHCGEEVVVQVSGHELHASHPEAMMSFGIARSGNGPVHEALCPYGNLFPDLGHFQRWAEATPEATVIPLSLTEVEELVRDVPAGGASCC